MEDVKITIKGLFGEIFRRINEVLPYIKRDELNNMLNSTNDMLNRAAMLFERNHSSFNEFEDATYDFYLKLAKGCMETFYLLRDVEEAIEQKREDYYDKIFLSLSSIETFIHQYENEELVTAKIEKFLLHCGAMIEYYRAIMVNELGSQK